MKPISIQRIYTTEAFEILWYIGKKCNFDCTYCDEGLHDSSSRHFSFAEMRAAWDRIVDKIPNKNILLSISGGEPTLNPDLPRLLKYIKSNSEKKIKVVVTSNGSKSTEYYNELFSTIDFLTYSYHIPYQPRNGSSQKIIELHKAALSKSVQLRVNLMFLPGHMNQMKEIAHELKAAEINYVLRRIRPKSEATLKQNFYSADEIEYMNSSDTADLLNLQADVKVTLTSDEGDFSELEVNSNYLNLHNFHNFKGWQCQAGSQNMTIWNDGHAYRCEADLRENRSMGSVYKEDFKIEFLPSSRCQAEKCVCLFDMTIPKKQT